MPTRTPNQRRRNALKRLYRKRRDRGEDPGFPFPATARKKRNGGRARTSDIPVYQAEVRARETPRPKVSQDRRPPFRQTPVPEGSWGVQPHPLDVRSSTPPPAPGPRVLPTINRQSEAPPAPRPGRSLDEVIRAALRDAPGKRLTKASLRTEAERASDYSADSYQKKLSHLRDIGEIDINNHGRRGRAQDDAIIALVAA